MANRNSWFWFDSCGYSWLNASYQGQGKYYIVAAYETDLFQGSSVRVVNGYIQTAQAAITKSTVGVLNGMFL